jgi:hypothetical protein
MPKYWSQALIFAVGIILFAGSPSEVSAQLDHLPYQLKYDRGQTVQPVFEGWSRNEDGSYEMHFGYFNRNYQEKLSVPVGAENRFEPGSPDRGQPTFFYVRSNRNIFTVNVPANFGNQRLVWSLTTQGRTLTAVGWLDPQWEILADNVGARQAAISLDPSAAPAAPDPDSPATAEPNDPPVLTISAPSYTVSLPAQLTITAKATDDGRPAAPRPRDPNAPATPRAGTQAQPPLLTPPENALELPVNIPQHENLNPPNPPRGKATVSYWVWRGPADVRIEPYYAEVDANGNATTTLTFSQPGEYRLRVRANDGQDNDEEFITVTVR